MRRQRVAAIIPCRADDQVEEVVARTLEHVDDVLIVGDRSPAPVRARLDRLASSHTQVVHRQDGRPAKGDALAFGVRILLARPHPPPLVVTLDADGQHPPECLSDFVVAAADSDMVIGDRSHDRRAMPPVRRAGNDAISGLLSLLCGVRLPDTQCGMRLFRSATLRRLPLPPGGFEAETEHVVRVATAGLRIGWVPIPAIYDGEASDFRPVGDSMLILRAALRGSLSPAPRRSCRPWPARQAV